MKWELVCSDVRRGCRRYVSMYVCASVCMYRTCNAMSPDGSPVQGHRPVMDWRSDTRVALLSCRARAKQLLIKHKRSRVLYKCWFFDDQRGEINTSRAA